MRDAESMIAAGAGVLTPAEAVPVPGAPSTVTLPLRLHAAAMEELLERLPPLVFPPRFNARHVRAAEPGALLALGILAHQHGIDPPELPLPPRALLPPMRVSTPLETAALFETINGAVFAARLSELGWSDADARTLAGLAGELARNALEHAGATPAWVAAWRTSPDELRLAVADAGSGFAASLGMRDERDALLQGLVHAASGSRQSGRGLGLRRVGERVAAWGGRMRVRSRTVALEGTPPWSDADVRDQLPFLPGVQVEVALPSPPGGLRRTGHRK
jgi:anti-sigma regulatory factor (Ser/Thr protein kinase)